MNCDKAMIKKHLFLNASKSYLKVFDKMVELKLLSNSTILSKWKILPNAF